VSGIGRKLVRAAGVALPLGCLLAALWTPAALAGTGEVFFYAKGPKRIPDGPKAAKLRFQSVLPNDVDPVLDYVTLSVRIKHRQTHDLVIRLKRPDFLYMGSPQSSVPRVITLSDRNTRGRKLGKGDCPDSNPGFAPHRFTTFGDAGPPPVPMVPPPPPPPIADGHAPYLGSYMPFEPLGGFNGYHAAPSTDPASPETWTLIVKDVRKGHKRKGHPAKLLCGLLYLHRI